MFTDYEARGRIFKEIVEPRWRAERRDAPSRSTGQRMRADTPQKENAGCAGIDRGLADDAFCCCWRRDWWFCYAASYYNAQDGGSSAQRGLFPADGHGAWAFAGMAVLLRLDYHLLQRKPKICLTLLGVSFLLLIAGGDSGRRQDAQTARGAGCGWDRSAFSRRSWRNTRSILYHGPGAEHEEPRSADALLYAGWFRCSSCPGAMFLLILLQPNLSTAGSILIVSAVMVMTGRREVGGIWRSPVRAGLALGTFTMRCPRPYRRARLMSFRDPFAYLSNEGYQLAQSLLAFGSGGLFGMGLGKGRQKYAFLPYPESDFIFAVVGEDLGLIGCLGILALFAAFIFFRPAHCDSLPRTALAACWRVALRAMIGVQCSDERGGGDWR